MTKFKDIIFEKDVAIHCPEEWMANNLLRYADSNAYWWRSGRKYTTHNNWNDEKQDTVYFIGEGAYDGIDHARKYSYEIIHYNDVVIKDEKYKDFPDAVRYALCSNLDKLFWDKPIKYQLPDTEGNLSEVKIGQHVWVSSDDGRFWEADIIENKDTPTQCKINGDYIVVKYHTGHCTHFNNITGVNHNGRLKITTNKPSRFHGKQDWSQAPEKAVCWAIDSSGYAYWYLEIPNISNYGDYWKDKSPADDNFNAGYRNDLINDRENMEVTDWKESLVMRPKDVYREVRDES